MRSFRNFFLSKLYIIDKRSFGVDRSAFEKRLKFVSGDTFLIDEKRGTFVKDFDIVVYDALCFVVALIDDRLDLGVDTSGGGVAVALCVTVVAAEEYLFVVIGVADKSE